MGRHEPRKGEVALLGPVGLDHPGSWGRPSAIAAEKAGIIKEGAAAVVRRQRPEAMAVIEAGRPRSVPRSC